MKHDENDIESDAQETSGDFGFAIRKVRGGQRVRRRGWNGKGMWIELFIFQGHQSGKFSIPGTVNRKVSDCVALRTAAGDMQTGWNPSQPDLLSDDWELVPDNEAV